MATTTTPASTGRGNCSHPPIADRRKEIRYPCHDPAEVRVVGDRGPSLHATILDISKSGLRITCPVELTPGLSIEVILPEQAVIFGEVRYCRAVGQEFQAGMMIKQAFYSMDLSVAAVYARTGGPVSCRQSVCPA